MQTELRTDHSSVGVKPASTQGGVRSTRASRSPKGEEVRNIVSFIIISFVTILITYGFWKGEKTMTQPRILQTAGGHTIEIHGAHLISNKLFDIVAMLFTAGDYFGSYEFRKIVFTDEFIAVTDGKPNGRYAMFENDSKMITISLKKHFLAACQNVQVEDDVNAKYLSLQAGLWFDMLTSIIHEAFHGVIWETSPEHCIAATSDIKRLQEIEDDCTNNANLQLIDMFRDLDIEPPTMAEEPYFGVHFMAFFVQQIKNQEADWAVRQEIMVESELIYYDDEDKDGIRTMRDWLRLTKEGDPDMQDDRWEKKPKKIPAAHVNPAVMVAQVGAPMPVIRPTTEIAVVAQQSTAAKEVHVDGEFVMLSEEDLIAEVQNSIGYIDEGSIAPDEVDSEETETVAVAAQPVVVQTPLPLETKPGTIADTMYTNCLNCGHNIEKVNFCPNCGTKKGAEKKTPPAFGTLPTTPQPPQTVATPEQTVQSQFIGGAGGQAPATTQPVSSGGRQFTQSLRTGLPNIGMDVGTMKNILSEIYMRMHNHIFDKCGFQVCGAGTGNSVGFNPSMIGNVLQPISIADIPRAAEFIIAYDRYDPSTGKTQMKVPVTNGLIAGKVSKSNNMPFYAIYINNNGVECKRILMAQNPFKQTTAGYSAGSVKAQQGNKISWVWDGADNQQYRKWFYKIENGFAEWL
jgi:hypothetical protein